MSKRAFMIFGVFLVAIGVLVPVWATNKESESGSGAAEMASNLEAGKSLFQTNCGTCHTLDKAGADGVVGPNLDDLLVGGAPDATKQRVLTAIANGINGRMPKGILQGPDAQQVAIFVAQVVGK